MCISSKKFLTRGNFCPSVLEAVSSRKFGWQVFHHNFTYFQKCFAMKTSNWKTSLYLIEGSNCYRILQGRGSATSINLISAGLIQPGRKWNIFAPTLTMLTLSTSFSRLGRREFLFFLWLYILTDSTSVALFSNSQTASSNGSVTRRKLMYVLSCIAVFVTSVSRDISFWVLISGDSE